MPKKSSKTVLPDPLPQGEVVTDIAKKKWILGPSIGVGGFGEIYSAAEYLEGSKKSANYQYVVKIEPHGNGPLFCEMHFFMRNAKPEMIVAWCTEHKIQSLGMPRYLGSGSHEHNGKKYRFLVMDKYGKDLWNIFLENKKKFPVDTVYRIALQLLEVLEYIHSNGYVHADIKGANILTGLSKQSQNQVFLVDFGLASHYTKKDFKPDPKKAHNGTIEYTSRDAHEGVPTRRGDIEILAYNMVQWMGTALPWENNLTDPVVVHNSKKKYMENITEFLKICFGKKQAPSALKEFLEYVSQMKYDTEPDYKKLNNILTKGLKSEGSSQNGVLVFTNKSKENKGKSPGKKQKVIRSKISEQKRETPKRKTRKPVEKEDNTSDSEIENDYPIKKSRVRKIRKEESNSETESDYPKKKSKTRKQIQKEESDEESEIVIEKSKFRKIKPSEKPSTNGFNAEMLRIQQKIVERKKSKTKRNTKKSNSSNSETEICTNIDVLDVIDGTPPENTVTRRKRHINKLEHNTDSDTEFTPRTLRQKR